ncbi:MAG: hypothetical protein U1E63_15195 [Burkholderiales bacterium]
MKTAWLGEQKAKAWDKAYQEMRAKYIVLATHLPNAAQSSPAAPPRHPRGSGRRQRPGRVTTEARR